MSDDFDTFKSGGGEGPPEGQHTAYLERLVVRDTKRGKALKSTWRTTDLDYYWESWHNTYGGGIEPTHQLLAALGIGLENLAGWDALEDELAQVEDAAYIVKVSYSSDGRFINTAIVEKPAGVQTQMANGASRTEHVPASSDIPADTRDLPQPAAAGATGDLFGDDDIPF
jgi:hypothetical protein